ncbi:MAG: hypothetical protein WCK84_03900 [Bacteroidota bacterium]
MVRKFLIYFLSPLIFLTLFWVSCKKTNPEPTPIPEWENTDPDSATLNVIVQTQQGIFLFGAYVYLYLDSLNERVLVRTAMTNGAGRVRFARLYPRKFYTKSFATYQGISLNGSFTIQMPPYATRDTILIVY